MDNVSHALAGVLIAEAVLSTPWLSGVARAPLRRSAYMASVLANNLPDLDFLCMPITSGKLGYLLHHRGHSHTLVAVVPCALAVLGIMLLFARLRRRVWARREWVVLWLLCLAGPICHLALDSTNNYGLHPFWPFQNRWYYGDVIFIVEPWFWVTTLPAFYYSATSRAARFSCLALLAGMIAATWLVRDVSVFGAAAVSLGTCAALGLLRARSQRFRLFFSFGASLLVFAVFMGCGRMARMQIEQIVSTELAHERVIEVVLTPAPANPLCFNAIVLTLSNGEYGARGGTLAALPRVLPAGRCPHPPFGATAQLGEARARSTESVRWFGGFFARAEELTALSQEFCEAFAFLRFARVPFWKRDASGLILGDLRYDRNIALDFADLRVYPGTSCPRHVPPWQPPRLDVLGARAAGTATEQ